jgi:hypothetical protein
MARRHSAWMATVGCVASLLAAAPEALAQCTVSVTATAATVDWNDPATWTPSRVPSATDRACVPAREGDQTVVVTTSASVLSLESDEGVRVQFGRLTVAEPSRVQRLELSGDLDGAGTIHVPGELAWTSGRMDGAGTTRVTGQATLTGSLLTLGDTRRLRNEGTLTLADGIGLHPGFQAAPLLENTGTITKPSGAATTFLDVPMALGGTVTARAGTLRLGGGGTVTGRIAGEDGGRVEFGVADYALADGAELAGSTRLASARLLVSGVATAGGSFEQAGGSIAGAGTFDVTGTLTWSGGTMDGAGVTRVRGAAALTGGFLLLSQTRRLRNEGTIALADGAGLGAAAQATPLLDNAGTIEGSGTSSLRVPLTGGGTVVARSGTLQLTGGGDALSGRLEGTGGRLEFGLSEYGLADGAQLAGEVRIANARVNVTSGTATASGGLALAGGGIGGAGTLDVTATFAWIAGTMEGSGTTRLRGASAVTGGFLSVAGTRRLRNEGTLTLGDGASIAAAVGAVPMLDNAGMVRKPAGNGTAFVSLPLGGGGTYYAGAGTLQLASFGAAPGSSGHFSAAAGAELRFTGEPVLATGAQLSDGVNVRASQLELAGDAAVSGAVRLDGGITGPGDLRVTGTLTWVSGNIRGDGLLAVAPGGRLSIQPAFFAGTARPLRNDGEVTWSSGDLNLEHGGLIDNRGTFTASSPGGWISATVPSETAIRNAGTLVVAITGTPIFWPPLENDGVVVLRSGTLELREPLTQSIDGELRFERAGLLEARAGARLQGTLRAAGATFQPGDRLAFLRYPTGGLRGRFDRVLGDPALTFAVEYDATEARLAVAGPPPAIPVAVATPTIANRAPRARGERVRARAGRRVRLRLLANDRDPEGDRLRVVVLAGPRARRDGVVTVRVRRSLRIRYVVVDPSGARSAPVTATITVRR